MESWRADKFCEARGSTRSSFRTITRAPSSGPFGACICRSRTPRENWYGCRAAASSTWWSICARSSPSFGAWWGVELSADNHRMLWVPPGLAHGILVTSPSADFLYKCTDIYSPADERTLAWNDPTLGIRWPLPPEWRPSCRPRTRAARALPTSRSSNESAGVRRRRPGRPGGRPRAAPGPRGHRQGARSTWTSPMRPRSAGS